MTLASSGAEGEAELRVADARRRAEQLDAELTRAGLFLCLVFVVDFFCDRLITQSAFRIFSLDEIAKAAEAEADRVRRALHDAQNSLQAEKRRAESASSSLANERKRADAAVAELETTRARLRETERALTLAEQQQQRVQVQYQQQSQQLSSGNSWFEKIKADPMATRYLGVLVVVTLMLLWVFVRERS